MFGAPQRIPFTEYSHIPTDKAADPGMGMGLGWGSGWG